MKKTFLFFLIFNLFIPTALALDWPAFNSKDFAIAQSEGKSIALVVHADWCATCRSQEMQLNRIANLPEYKDFILFRIDFDKQKEVMNDLRVPSRSTILIFRGTSEVGRIVAENRFEVLRDLFSFGLNK